LIADSATFALKAGLWVRLVRFVMFAPDPRQHCRRQAGNPPIGLSEFPRPPLPVLEAAFRTESFQWFRIVENSFDNRLH